MSHTSTQAEWGSVLDALLSEDVTDHLERLAADRAAEYQTNDPFPHIVIDNFLPSEVLEWALADFPDPRQLRWIKYDAVDEVKLAFPNAEKLPSTLRDVLFFFNSAPVLRFLETLTGIGAIVPDPYFTGGGLHQIQPGGYLGVHADFNKYEKLGLDRRLNLLLYLNKDWTEEYGGHLELWDESMTTCAKRVLPVFNRCVVFSTTDTSYHGHPNPLTCPKDRTRRSLATYYYTNGRPEEEASEAHSTLFQQRPGQTPLRGASPARAAKKIVRALLPPIVTDTYYALRARK